MTKRWTPKATAQTVSIAGQYPWPKTIHKPVQPEAKPMYMGLRTWRYIPTTTRFFGGAMGAGVPWPVQPKSHTQRHAIANPSTEGITASQRQRAPLAAAMLKPSQCGSSQNDNEKKPVPTTMEANAASQ